MGRGTATAAPGEAVNWTGTPSEREPLAFRALSCLSRRRYTPVPLSLTEHRVTLHLFGRFWLYESGYEWWVRLHGHPIVASWRGAPGEVGAHWTTYAK